MKTFMYQITYNENSKISTIDLWSIVSNIPKFICLIGTTDLNFDIENGNFSKQDIYNSFSKLGHLSGKIKLVEIASIGL